PVEQGGARLPRGGPQPGRQGGEEHVVSRHRAGSPRRRAAPQHSKHRAEVRPRYGRIATLVAALAVVAVALMGATGLLPTEAGDADPAAAIDRTGTDRPTSTQASRPIQRLADDQGD